MNLFISNFKGLWLAIGLFIISQFAVLAIGDVAQTPSKQIVKEKRQWARDRHFKTAEEGKDTVLFFGNSHAAAGIIPEVFDKANNGKTVSYNFSLVGLQLLPHYFLLKDYLSHHPAPKYIFISTLDLGQDIDSFPQYAVQGANLMEVVEYARLRKNMDVLFNYLIPSRLMWPDVERYLTGKVLKLMPPKIKEYHRHIYMNKFGSQEQWGHNRAFYYEMGFVDPEKLRKERLELLRKQRGYYYIVEESAIGGQVTEDYLKGLGLKLYNCRPINKVMLKIGPTIDKLNPYVKSFFDLTKKHGITVMLMPNYTMSAYFPECLKSRVLGLSLPSVLWKYAYKMYPNVHLLDVFSSIQYPYDLFSDPSHLNPKGAVFHSQYLSKLFRMLDI